MSRYNDQDFKIQYGCRPCNFVCDCCKHCHSRCCSGVTMLYRGNKHRPDKILCECCHRRCLVNQSCQVIEEEL